MSTAISRKSGADSVSTGHDCDVTTVTEEGSVNVFINGIGACRVGDAIHIHTIKVGDICVPHTAYITSGSNTVFINGIPVSRLGDAADKGFLTTGSSNVFAGDAYPMIIDDYGMGVTTEDGFILVGVI